MEEVWKDIPNYENYYRISSLGNIKSLKRQILSGKSHVIHNKKERILKPGFLRGYLHVTLCKEGVTKIFKVHRLVMQAFNPIDNIEKYQVNHIDGNKSNNNINNLEWCTEQENQLHRYKELDNNKISKYSYITKVNNKWRLRGFKNKHIGYFKTENEAKIKFDELFKNNPEIFNFIDNKSIKGNDLF